MPQKEFSLSHSRRCQVWELRAFLLQDLGTAGERMWARGMPRAVQVARQVALPLPSLRTEQGGQTAGSGARESSAGRWLKTWALKPGTNEFKSHLFCLLIVTFPQWLGALVSSSRKGGGPQDLASGLL